MQQQENVITYSNNQSLSNTEPHLKVVEETDSESEEESQTYNVIQPINQFEDKLTENFESKEVISEMVSQLKETLIQNNIETLQNELQDVAELKNELTSNKDELFDLLNNTTTELKEFDTTETNKVMTDSKKKEEELMKMKVQDLKDLAKKKNIKILDQSNKPKKKETLVKEILTCT
jgi:hypothetical protein